MRTLALGAAGVVGTTVVSGLCMTAGLGEWSIVVVVLVALGMIVVAGRESIVLGFVGIVVATACGVMALRQEAPLFGASFTDIAVAQAPAHRAAFYRFTDGQVLADRVGDADVWAGGRNTHYVAYTLHVAPLVGADWTPEAPVPAWVVTAPHQGVSRAQWSVPLRAGVAVNTTDTQEVRDAIRSAETRYGLTSAAGAPALRWVADPVALQIAEWRRLGVIALVGALVWTLATAGFALRRRLRAQRRRR